MATVAVYDSLVRMAQTFSMRYPLIDGQGNFGSIDGDPPAAYRYTECRLTPLAERMLADIDKDTVDFVDNFDGSNREPEMLPGQVPNLLINGSDGIAVGMATNIPPHNLGEVCDALLKLIEKSRPDDGGDSRNYSGAGFSDRRTIAWARGDSAGVFDRARDIDDARAGRDRNGEAQRACGDNRARDSVPGKQDAADRANRRLGE